MHKDQQMLARDAWNPRKAIAQGGVLKFIHGGEYHAFNPDVVAALHEAVRSNDYEKYREFAHLVNDREPMVLRDLLALRPSADPVTSLCTPTARGLIKASIRSSRRWVYPLSTAIVGPSCSRRSACIIRTASFAAISASKFNRLLALTDPHYAHEIIDLIYPEATSLRDAIEAMCDQAIAAVRAGKTIIVFSDREIAPGKLPMHPLLATGALHHRLVRERLRCDANIVVETATARDPHHFAVLIGYGATAVCPYLAYDCLRGSRL